MNARNAAVAAASERLGRIVIAGHRSPSRPSYGPPADARAAKKSSAGDFPVTQAGVSYPVATLLSLAASIFAPTLCGEKKFGPRAA